MSKATEISVGDVVRLKSGGPSMTVEGVISGDVVNCVWFSDERKYNTFFVASTLTAATAEAADDKDKGTMQ